MMETPEKNKNNQITTSIENLQRSPVFDFLDNLSPIKPVKSSHFRGSINPLSFASLPPVFASPQENPLKVLKFTQRFHVTDQAKPEFASYDNDTNSYAPKNFEQDKENLDPLSSGPAFDVLKILVSPEKIDHDSNNPNPQKGFYRNVEANLEGSSRTDESIWEDYISDETDLFALIESACEEQVDPATTYYKNIKNAMKNMMSHGSMFSGEQALKRIENAEENLNIASGSSISNPIIEKVGCGQHSGLSNDLSRHGFIHPSSNSPMLINSDNINLSKQQQSVSRNDSPHLILSEFGLQLNPLSRTLVEYANERSTSFDQKSINTEKDQDFPKADRPRSNKHMRRQESNTISPKKKRRKSESIESCKRCNCKKSKCLKLYCECFAAGVYCVEPCACVDCFNKPTHAETVITTRKQIEARNPLAFAPKVIKGDDSYFQSDIGENSSSTPASARHKRGCNCKKSGCLKKYCECYQSGVGCSINCRCENCKNAFGRKDSFAVAMEAELDEEEEYGDEEDGDRWKLRNNRFSTKQKPTRCSFPAIPHSSSLQHIPKFGRSFEDDSDKDEIPEILRFRQCPKPNKVLSPNGKRVSPPQTRQHLKMSSSSPGLRSSSRRLILTSIPSFPSLASYNQ